MAYEVNDTVLYGIHGVCRIADIEEEKGAEYYVLRPVYDEKAKVFVPKGNERLYLQQQSQTGRGKKLYKVDEKFMKEAEKMLYEEFAHVLDIRPEQVVPFITQQIKVE